MYIAQLSIRNYRIFKDFSIKLKPLTLIIGENNIGKSNLLDSIALIFSQEVSFFKKRFLEAADFNYDTMVEFKRSILNHEIPPESIKFPEIRIEALLTDWDDQQEAVVCDWFSNSTFSEATLTYVFAPVSNFDQKKEIESQREFLKRYENEITKEAFDKMPESVKLDLINFPISKYHYSIYGGAAGTSANLYHLNQLKFELLDALRDACSELVASHSNKLLFRILNAKEENEYQDLKKQLIGLQEAIDKNKALNDIKNGISEQLDRISLKTDETSNLVNLIFSMPDVSDLLKKISLIYGDNPIKIDRNGTGRNNLLFISLVLSYIEDITRAQSAYFRVVGLEEPESHLHPNLQDHLAHSLEKLIKKSDGKEFRKDIQLIVTSHSTHITTKINFDNTVVMFNSDKGILTHYILDGFSTAAAGKKQIKYLNKYLDAVNTNLFYSRKIILVEGISEKLLMPVFFEMATSFSPEKASCCVINVNGLAFSNFLEIIRNGFFQKCLVLTDQDTDTKTKDRAEKLAKEYEDVTHIKVAITTLTTFEKDLIEANKTGQGRNILLKVLKDVRPLSGKAYETNLGTNDLVVSDFFTLIEDHKSSFAYSLMLHLSEDCDGFNVPDYIVEGLKFFEDVKAIS